MSRAQKYVGAFGNGSRMKFIANHLVTIHNLASAEAFVLGEMAGLDEQVGRLLSAVHDWWIAGDFTADRASCLVRLEDAVTSTR
jgi:3-hydroxyisobutyrate dehydrogenase-like beta-hydroxyacid dehydrogenase